jgi:hypothetical protein
VTSARFTGAPREQIGQLRLRRGPVEHHVALELDPIVLVGLWAVVRPVAVVHLGLAGERVQMLDDHARLVHEPGLAA